MIACETYSFHRLFKRKEMSLELFAAKMRELDIPGISLNDLYFAEWGTSYLARVKAAIEREGRRVVAFIMDLNGDLATENSDERAENIEAIRGRLKVAQFFGAPVARINVGKTGKGEEADGTIGVERVTSAFLSLLPAAKKLGVRLAIENHGGPSARAEWIEKIIRGTDPEWVGSCLDFKNWPKGSDLYAEIGRLAKHAFHAHAKAHEFDHRGEETGCDFARVLRILKDAGYAGALSIEWEGTGDCVEGVRKTRDLIHRHWK